MEITSGLRCPSFCQNLTEAWDTHTYTIKNYVAGSQVVLVPRDSVFLIYRDASIMPTVGMLSGYSVSGNTITLNTWWSDNWTRSRTFSSSIWQILPAVSGAGMLIQDSTDFMSITDATMSGYCVWRGTVTFTGTWSTPATNISRDQYMVFARWSASGVVIDFDGYTITAVTERDGDDAKATVTMQIAIFASGVAPTPGTGLNIFKNSTCVFSTTKRPFIYRNQKLTPSWTDANIGNSMVLLGRWGFDSSTNGGWDYLKWAGLVMVGNSVRCGKGKVSATWTDRYPIQTRRLTSLSIPYIDAMY